jgi:S1-C subfamily serine protease
MSGPKHLWSGDWEKESRQPAAAQPAAPDHEPDPQPAPAPSRGRFTRQQFAIAFGTGVATAAVAITLIVTLGGGQKPNPQHRASTASKAPGAPAQPQTSGGGGLNNAPTQSSQTTTVPAVTGPSASWMGMQIVTSPSGVVVSTVRLGSPADQAGFEPGDQLQSVDGHIIGSVSELKPDTSALKVGSEVTIAVMRSSVQLTSSLPMTQHPTIHP